MVQVDRGASVGRPRRRPSLLDDVTAALLDYAREAGLGKGGRLPSTRAMAERFGVATPTMREVLRRLEATGAVVIRHGSGVYLAEDAPRLLIANPARLQTAGQTALDVLDARLLVEPTLAARAAVRCTAADSGALQTVLDEADAAIAAGDEERMGAATMRFHGAIADLAGNAVLAESVRAITELYIDHQVDIGRLFNDPQLDQREHRELLAAISGRHPQRARRLMTAHLTEVRDVVAARLAERTDNLTTAKK
jgi:GntR family transcriptional repressor for pyruvate dehydrogenase complex